MDDPGTIFEVGCGTGMFSIYTTKTKPSVKITASEFDDLTLAWAKANRGAPNISYQKLAFSDCVTDQFDLVVAMEVIEHIFDYVNLL